MGINDIIRYLKILSNFRDIYRNNFELNNIEMFKSISLEHRLGYRKVILSKYFDDYVENLAKIRKLKFL